MIFEADVAFQWQRGGHWSHRIHRRTSYRSDDTQEETSRRMLVSICPELVCVQIYSERSGQQSHPKRHNGCQGLV